VRGLVVGVVQQAVHGTLSRRVQPPPSFAARCGQDYAGVAATMLWFHASDGTQLDGAELGSGPAGVVLAHEYPADLCGWADEAVRLAAAGYHVLAFDFRGLGASHPATAASHASRYPDDVQAAVRELRSLGARKVVVVGASLGGTAAMVAASRMSPQPDGVISVSGEANLDPSFGTQGTLDALAVVPRLRAPLLVMGAARDPLIPPADVHRLVARAGSRQRAGLVLPGSAHGWDLITGVRASHQANARLLGFLRAHAGPPPR
jgi:pimeloyl-ACP methyl ester carboxylesterase